jgi:hypothetical protein
MRRQTPAPFLRGGPGADHFEGRPWFAGDATSCASTRPQCRSAPLRFLQELAQESRRPSAYSPNCRRRPFAATAPQALCLRRSCESPVAAKSYWPPHSDIGGRVTSSQVFAAIRVERQCQWRFLLLDPRLSSRRCISASSSSIAQRRRYDAAVKCCASSVSRSLRSRSAAVHAALGVENPFRLGSQIAAYLRPPPAQYGK